MATAGSLFQISSSTHCLIPKVHSRGPTQRRGPRRRPYCLACSARGAAWSRCSPGLSGDAHGHCVSNDLLSLCTDESRQFPATNSIRLRVSRYMLSWSQRRRSFQFQERRLRYRQSGIMALLRRCTTSAGFTQRCATFNSLISIGL